MKLNYDIQLNPPLPDPIKLPYLKDAPREVFGIAIDPASGADSWTVFINRRGDVIFLEDLDVFQLASDRLNRSTFRFREIPASTKVTASWAVRVSL